MEPETYFFDRNNFVSNEQNAIFKLRIYKKDITTQQKWNEQERRIRESNTGSQEMNNFKMCFGILNKSFFSTEDMEDTDALMILDIKRYNPRTKTTAYTLCGFVMLDFKNSIGHHDNDNDMDVDEDSEDEEDMEVDDNYQVLYINAICANYNHVKKHLEAEREAEASTRQMRLRIGNLLMQQCEWFARRNQFSIIELSSLAYVINYYRRFGFKHVKDCSKEEDPEIVKLIPDFKNVRFAKDDDLIEAFIVGAAQKNQSYGTDESERRTWLMANLNDYFHADDITFQVEGERIVAYNGNGEENVKITELVANDQRYIFNYLDKLRQKGFAVACQDEEEQRENPRATRDEYGDILVMKCDDEGYTMVKCLNRSAPPPEETNPHYYSSGETKTGGRKTKKYRKKNKRKTRKHQKKKTRKHKRNKKRK